MPPRMRWLALLVLLAAPAAHAERLRYEGLASDPEDGTVLYREIHGLDRAGGEGERIVLYQCPDGRAFARKTVRYRGDFTRPEFALEDARLGYAEGVRRGPGGAEVFVRRANDGERSAPLADDRDIVVDAGFDDFVHRHWDALAAGEAVRFRFLVPSRLEPFDFKVRRDREDVVDGRPALVLRLGLGAWWGFLAPHIEVAYAHDDRVLLRFEGLSNIRDAEGRNLVARIEFPAAERRRLAAGELDALRRAPLVRDCG